MPTETRAGIETRWIEAGHGDRRALAIHCSLASSRSLGDLLAHLADTVTATAIDLPGHGGTAAWDGVGDYLIRAIDVAETFVDAPVDLIGHSLGGVVALGVMARRPEMVRSATLFEPVFFAAAKGSEGFDRYTKDHAPIMADIAAGRFESAARTFTAQWGNGQPWEMTPAPIRRKMTSRIEMIATSSPGLRDDTAGILDDPALSRIAAPVTLLRGAQCHPVVPAIQDGLAARLPNVRIAEIPGAGHMGPISHPEAVAAEVRATMARA